MHRLELKVPPLIVGGAAATGMWLVSYTMPAFAYPPLRIVAVGLGLAGVAIIGLAMLWCWMERTTMNPMNPSSASVLVTSGIYSHTRNPMYLGMLLLLIAWALYVANVLALLFLPAFIFYMNRFQIEPEERALRARFGREYLEYTSRVRRWI